MTFLFLFAHPDDETVACAGTIYRLSQAGHKVVVVSVTDGSAGEVMPRAQAHLEKLGSVGVLRKQELSQVAAILGISETQVLGFQDGYITNQEVWGKLTLACVEAIDTYKPDVVVTFDHTGWYFHLDHVGVSIAATLAVKQAEHQVKGFFHTHVLVNSSRWQYVFGDTAPITHICDVSDLKAVKLQAIEAHQSQDITTIINYMNHGFRHYELYQQVSGTPELAELLSEDKIFIPVTAEHEAELKRKTIDRL